MMLLRQLLALHQAHAADRTLPDVLGDGYLYAKNPTFRRVRDAAVDRGFELTDQDPGDYFGFPLIALGTLLETRRIPYRPNFRALAALEQARPGYYALSDLRLNRPAPNYLLHESAHAVAFAVLFGRPDDVSAALGDRACLGHVMAGEAFAMAAEYLAACSVEGAAHDWFFSINSYRHRSAGKKAVGDLAATHGLRAAIWVVLAAFLYNNFDVEKMTTRRLDRILSFGEATARLDVDRADKKRLRSALGTLMLMSPEFRHDTSKLFLTMLGYERDIAKVLEPDPLDLAEANASLGEGLDRLVDVLDGTALR